MKAVCRKKAIQDILLNFPKEDLLAWINQLWLIQCSVFSTVKSSCSGTKLEYPNQASDFPEALLTCILKRVNVIKEDFVCEFAEHERSRAEIKAGCARLQFGNAIG